MKTSRAPGLDVGRQNRPNLSDAAERRGNIANSLKLLLGFDDRSH
jgi:hypothetical protein